MRATMRSDQTAVQVSPQLNIMNIMGAWDAVRSPRPRWVYFAERDGRIKIGSSNQVAARMRTLDASLLAVTRGGFDAEWATHRLFDDYALGHEWFADVPPLRDYIAGLPRPLMPLPSPPFHVRSSLLTVAEAAAVLRMSKSAANRS